MNRQIGWSTESNLLWQIGNQIDRMTGVIGSSLSTFVPQSRTLTINGVTYDLSANRSWTVAGGISGTGPAGQVAYWTGVSSVAGSNNLFWNNTNQTLGIGTTGPIVVSAGYSYLALNNSVNGGVIEFQSNGTRIATINNNSSAFDIETKISAPITFGTNGTERLKVSAIGNILMGSPFTDNGQRLQVYGDTYLKGSGSTSATTGFQVQNSAGNNIFRIANNGAISLGNSSSRPLIFTFTTNQGAIDFSGTNLSFYNSTGNLSATSGAFAFGGDSFFQTSGSHVFFNINMTFIPTSGTAAFANLVLAPGINQTGGANGITRGLYVSPSLTSAADWRSIEWSNNTGFGLYGAGTAPNYLGGDLTVVGVFRETVTTNRQTASYSLVLLDRGKLVEMNVATANNLTVPLDSAVAFPVGTKIDIAQYGAGQTTVVATGGVTVRSAGGALKLAAQYSGATLVKIATNEWYLFGDITV